MKRIDRSRRVEPPLPERGTVLLPDGGEAAREAGGVTLQQRLEESCPFPEEEVLALMEQLCDILDEMHHADPPLVHGDLRPERLLLTPDGTLRLLAPETASGTGAFSAYTAPEQYGRGECSPRADLYSVGVLMNVLLTGLLPAEQPARGRLALLIERCTQVDPAERIADAASVREMLSAARGRKLFFRGKTARKSGRSGKSASGTSFVPPQSSEWEQPETEPSERASLESDRATFAPSPDSSAETIVFPPERPESEGNRSAESGPSEDHHFESQSSAEAAADPPAREESTPEEPSSPPPKASQRKAAKSRRSRQRVPSPIARFAPPGFRTRKIWKMLLAGIGYLLLFALALSLDTEVPATLWPTRIIFLLFGLEIILFSGNYLNIRSRWPLTRSPKRPLRVLGTLCTYLLLIFLTLFLLSLVELFLGAT